MQFFSFPKIPRLNREIIVTEKIDGTNACVAIDGDTIKAGSRTRWITPEDDNFGFAKWVEENKEELLKLGPGRHFGEWWGSKIQRGYGQSTRRFSLFNTSLETKPDCCEFVPVLYKGPFDTEVIKLIVNSLKVNGSVAAPGYMNPEGIIVFHTAGNHMYKVTCEKDESRKNG